MNKDIYYATDKEFFDAIASKKQVYTISLVRDLCKARHTFVSEKDEREVVIEYFSELPHSVLDLINIQEMVKTKTKTEKNSSIKLEDADVDSEKIIETLNELKNSRTQNYDEKYTTISSDQNHIIVDVEYTDIEYGNTRLRQKQERSARIEIEKNKKGEISIRIPANERASNIREDFVSKLQEKINTTIKKRIIDLSDINSSRFRTKFFIDLIKNIKSTILKEVNSIHISASDIENEVDDEEIDEAKQNVLAKLQTAIFNGENLLQTPEYADFEKRGFYITGIKWQALYDKDICILEAEFKEQKDCRNFVYDVKGVYKYMDKNSSYQKTLKPLEGSKKTELLKNIEISSLEIFDRIKEEYSQNS